ncbi:MAG: hypothetical protein O9341_10315 [Paucibacter sp.]|nr:hypothetical protein [Roseateles sp.]
MTALKPPSSLERLAGNPATEAGLTLAANAMAAMSTAAPLLTPLIPVLAKSLAAERQRKRVEAAILEMSATLESQAQAITNLTDAQFKLINESVLSVLSSTQTEKLAYLKRVARNTAQDSTISDQEAIALSRVVRDISAEEIEMLLRSFGYERIRIGHQDATVEGDGKTLRITFNTPNAFCVSGLLSLGVLSPGEDSWGGDGSFIFTGIAAKLITLLRDA